MDKRKFFVLVIGLLPLLLFGQVRFSTNLNADKVGRNDYVQVDYVIQNAEKIEQFAAPSAFKGFTLVSGPNQQSGMSLINGVLTKYQGVSYVLKPSGPGRLLIPGASAVVDGKSMQSNAVYVQVLTTASNAAQGNLNPAFGMPAPEEPEVNEEYFLRPGESMQQKIRDNLIVKLDVSKTTCYEGEPVIATYKLCSRLKSESRVTRRPSLSGFSVYDMLQPESYQPSIEKINGKLFNVHIIRKVQLYPLQSGTYDLDAVELQNTVQFLRLDRDEGGRTEMQQLLNQYMNGMLEGKPEEHVVTLSSKSVTIKVLPLPEEGKPENFDGAVGSFTLRSSLPKSGVTPNETGKYQVELAGEGNFPLINEPQVKWPAGIDSYQPEAVETTDKSVAPMKGTKLFTYSFTAKKTGLYTLPSIQFSYFDPKAKAYKTVKSDSVTLIVKPGAPAAAKEKKKGLLPGPDTSFNWTVLLWLVPVIAVALLGILFVKKKPAEKRSVEPVLQVIPEPVVDHFKAAREAMDFGNAALFYRELSRVIWMYLEKRLDLRPAEHNKAAALIRLRQAGVEETRVLEINDLLSECERALYMPEASGRDMAQALMRAERVMQ